MARHAHREHLRGTTLIECVAAILVLGIAIPPLVSLFHEVAAKETDRMHRSVALMYAESLMEELASKAYEDPELASGSFGTEEALRTAYDDIDDYDGLSNSPPVNVDGALLADYAGFQRSVSVVNVTDVGPDSVTPEPDGTTLLKRITVTIDWPGGQVALTTMRTLLPRGPSPIAEALSGAAVTDDNKKKMFLPLINISGGDVVVDSFALSADLPTETLHRVKLDGETLVNGEQLVPTGTLSVSAVDVDKRTVPAFQSPTLEIEFSDDPEGTIAYLLILNFTDGTRSVITFTVDW